MSDDLANQIAAGEVVERPASAVKELVENSLDAGATAIRVELEDGGVALLRVADNGVGMDPEDAALAVERHATSKLRTSDDLFEITTLGFRGEALPSIASVSRFELLTRRHDAVEGTAVRIDGGGPVHVSAVGCPPGTQVTIRDLFFNTPARRKFLRTRVGETRHVNDALQRIAMVRPDVGFTLVHNGRTLLDLGPVTDPLERARELLGRDEGRSLYPIVPLHREGVSVTGCFAAPSVTRRTGDGIQVFVNGRFIRDRRLQMAVRTGYEQLVDRGRFPVAVVQLEVEPHLVDVNVHPMKIEVRFRDADAAFSAVRRALLDSLARAPWIGDDALGPLARASASSASPADPGRPEPAQGALPVRSWVLTTVRDGAGGAGASPVVSPPVSRRDAPSLAPGVGTGGGPVAVLPPAEAASPAAPHQPPAAHSGFFTGLHYIGQFRGTYLLTCDASGLVIVDQHAAHERITFERLRATWAERRAHRQPMLLPTPLTLDSLRASVLEEHIDTFERLGYEIEPFGGLDFHLRAVPAILGRSNHEALLRDAIDELRSHGASRRIDDAIDAVLVRMACHGSVRAGQALHEREVRALLEDLDRIDFGGNCPHGRPVYFRMSLDELERRFGRQ